jgi:hypothetical protein
MCVHDDRRRRTAPGVRPGSLTLGICLLGFAGLIHAAGQETVTQSHKVTVTSDPPGAMIWKKDGRDYACTNIPTPGSIDLAFHGDSDLQRLRVRMFGDAVLAMGTIYLAH